ncbi:MAG TPA: LacI family DNA-binding transcriptional regulator [Candidatus Limnocylindrales bacterium]|nr:LacI family DNA-binding transcriptional regulator [Candidatus Limnocylindrales bacterium]
MATTIADVARRAGVSTATVSRVLSGIGRARPETHARVEAAARELGFRPSDVARSLKRRSTLTLGLIVTDIENPYFPQLVRAVEDAASGEGYAILLCNADDDPEREASYLDFLVERRVDGLIIAASTIGMRQGEWLATASLPVVLINTAATGDPQPTIVSDNRGGGSAAARHLLDFGHRRFGYLMPPPRNLDAPERLAGVHDALDSAGLSWEGPGSALAIGHGAPTVTGGESAMSELLERAPRPTAVIAYNDLMAIGAMRAIRTSGFRIPTDISLIGFDDVAFAAYVEPALTTLRQETAEMGRWAVATVTERIKAAGRDGSRPIATGGRRVVPVHLEIRASTGPAPDS